MLMGNPRRMILIGFVLVVIGVALPLLMILDMMRTTFLLSLIAHGASVSGLFLGFIGTLMIVRTRKEKDEADRFGPMPWSDDLDRRR